MSGDGFGKSHDNGITRFGEDVREKRGGQILVGTITRPNAQSLANVQLNMGLSLR
jgi:hypothetical protein